MAITVNRNPRQRVLRRCGSAVAAITVWANAASAQTLPGLWGSSSYEVRLAVSGSAVTGTFTSPGDQREPPGTLAGQLRADGKAFTATWTMPAGPNAATFSTWLAFSAKGEVLRGYRWSDESQPSAFSLHRAVKGVVLVPVGPDDGAAPPPANPPPRYARQVVGPDEGDDAQRACRGNLKSLCLAMHLYAGDHDDRLPDASRWMDEIVPYVTGEKCFQCPAAAGVPCGYAMNAALSGALLSSIPRPSEVVLLFESKFGTRNAAAGLNDAALSARHGGGSLCVYIDTRVERWTLQDPKPTAPGTALGGFLSGFSQSDGQR